MKFLLPFVLLLSGCATKPVTPPMPTMRQAPQFSALVVEPSPPVRRGIWWTALIDGKTVALPHPALEFDVERTDNFKSWTLYVRTNQPPVEIPDPGYYRVGVHPNERNAQP